MNEGKNRWRPQVRIALFLVMALLTGFCGKKAPPRPPVQPELPLVKDLQAGITETGVRLTWTIPSPVSTLAGFNLYRSDPLPQSTDCPGCPRDYKLIDSVEVKPNATSFESMDRSLDGTGRFHYIVVPFDARGRAGPDSNEASLAVGSKQ